MADGLDNAAEVFRGTIAPGSGIPPRDEQGRFSPTASRPEPLFAERQTEGDPLTGDVRDGGEDQRLAAIERRVADGREEDGDRAELEQGARRRRLSDDAEERRQTAAARRRTEPAPDQQERSELQSEPTDQDAEESDRSRSTGEPGEGDGGSERDAAGEREAGDVSPADEGWAITHEGKEVAKIEVDVGGEKREVSLADMIRGYASNEMVAQREQGLVQNAQNWENQAQAAAISINNIREEYIKRLEYAGRLIQDLTPKELNWEAEYQSDPRAAREKEKVYAHVRTRMAEIANAMLEERSVNQQAQTQAAQQTAHQNSRYIQWGKEEFQRRTRIPWDTINNEFATMRKAGQEYGFSEHELATVYDPRMLEVLYDASQYRRLTAYKPRPVRHDTGRTLTPGAARPIGGPAARRGIDDALRNQSRQGGSIDATAAVFERLLR
jgi:hypothetical protein